MPKKMFDGKSELYDVTVENITATGVEPTEVYDKRLFIPEYAKEYPASEILRLKISTVRV